MAAPSQQPEQQPEPAAQQKVFVYVESISNQDGISTYFYIPFDGTIVHHSERNGCRYHFNPDETTAFHHSIEHKTRMVELDASRVRALVKTAEAYRCYEGHENEEFTRLAAELLDKFLDYSR